MEIEGNIATEVKPDGVQVLWVGTKTHPCG